MADPPAAPEPCCFCAAPGGKHCTKCKSRHYCGKACQLIDWKHGHKEQCKKLATEFSDHLLDELMPLKLKIKEEPPIVEGVSPADGTKARLSVVRTEKTAEVIALNNDAPDWRGTCAICLELLPANGGRTFYDCCCKRICTACYVKCRQHDSRCPLCRTSASKSDAEWLRRMQKHVDKGNAEAQIMLGTKYFNGGTGLQQNFKRAFLLFELAAAQGTVQAQDSLGLCYAQGRGVEVDHKTAAQRYRRAAEQENPHAQYCLGVMFENGEGVAQSYADAVRWYRLAAAQGQPNAIFNLAACYAHGDGVSQDLHEALRLCKRAAALGHAGTAAAVEKLDAILAAARAARRGRALHSITDDPRCAWPFEPGDGCRRGARPARLDQGPRRGTPKFF